MGLRPVFIGAVISVAAVVAGLSAQDESSWATKFRQHLEWLEVAPNRAPPGATIVAADGIGEDGPVTIRTLTFMTESEETVTLCVARDRDVALSECGPHSRVRGVDRAQGRLNVAVSGAHNPKAWLEGYDSTAPTVANLSYIP